jgi:hypothetical protein
MFVRPKRGGAGTRSTCAPHHWPPAALNDLPPEAWREFPNDRSSLEPAAATARTWRSIVGEGLFRHHSRKSAQLEPAEKLSLVGSEENLAARRTEPAPAFAAFRQGELAETRLIFFGVRSAALHSPSSP